MFKHLVEVFTAVVIIAMITGTAGYIRKQRSDVYKQVNVLLEECEAQLPRDKHCKIIAVEDK